MNNSIKSQLLKHLLALGVFIAITVAYLFPVLEGKKLPTHDIKQFNGAAAELQKFKADNDGEASLWTNSMFGGMPGYQIATPYPMSMLLIKPVYQLVVHGFPKPMNMLFLYLFGFYVLLISFKVDWRLAIAGALAFGFSSYNIIIIDAGHNTKALAVGLAPFIIAGVNLALRSKKYWILGAALAGVALAFQVKVNHLQITYYTAFIIAAMGISWLVFKLMSGETSDLLKRAGVLIIAALLGVGTNSGAIMMTAEYGKETTRGKSELTLPGAKKTKGLPRDYITGWSYGVAETGTFLIPNFYGGGNANTIDYESSEVYNLFKPQAGRKEAQKIATGVMYWGIQPGTNGPVYLGAFICFLFVFSFLVVSNKLRIWVLGITALATMLAWGSNFHQLTNFFIDHFPGYNKFRTVTMILIIVEITVPLLAIVGLHKVLSGKVGKDKTIMALKISTAVVGGLCLLFALMPGAFFDFVNEKDLKDYKNFLDPLISDRQSLMSKDAFRSLLFVLVGAGAIFAFTKGKLKGNAIYLVVIGVIAMDGWVVAGRFLRPDKFETQKRVEAKPERVDQQIMKDDGHFRVLNLSVSTFNDATTSNFHKSLGGYHGAKLQRIQDLISFKIDPEMRARNKAQFQDPNKSPVINMFNTKYFIVPLQGGKKTALPNEGALGNAWFVENVDVVENANEEMQALGTFDPANTAVTDKRFATYLDGFSGGQSSGNIKLEEYQPNYLKYSYDTDKEQFAVFSEVYYRGNKDWLSSIDGKEAEHIRVNYHLRGMRVPAGKGIIEFRFDPPTYQKGETYSMISSLLLVLLILGGAFITYRESKKEGEAENG